MKKIETMVTYSGNKKAVGENMDIITSMPNLEKVDSLHPTQKLPRKQRAVCVRHAHKHYGSKNSRNHIFNDLNMTVEKGTIYGLLGASGSGKTTLLSCIVGRNRLNDGKIWVLGFEPGTKGSGIPGKKVGYMPQEIALYGEFTIRETMMYFGWIFGMKSGEINERLQFLLKLLELPTETSLIRNLSGGQKRRVSFAVALIHDPELIILDEPTAGVDTLLRQSIWNHLLQITKDGNKTVIITTHYIEEARQAHAVGLMRSGQILGEGSPQRLLEIHDCLTLEAVFLKLSRKHDLVSQPVPPVTEPEKLIYGDLDGSLDWQAANNEEGPTRGSCFSQKCGRIKALLYKNCMQLWRNVGLLFFIFALPAIEIIFFCLAIGRDPSDLKIAVVNHEVLYTNRSYQACGYESGCHFINMSCRYLDTLKNSALVMEYYPDTISAVDAVKAGEVWGALYFSENFTNAFVKRLVFGKDADKETLDQSEVLVWLDVSSYQIGLIIQRDLQLGYQDLGKELIAFCGQHGSIAGLHFSEPLYGSNKSSFTDFLAAGVILSIIFFLAVALTSTALIVERTKGLLDRTCVAGVSSGEILFSHTVVQFVVMSIQMATVLIFLILVFGVQCEGNIGLVLLLTVLQGLCGMSYGLVISSVCTLECNAIQLALGSFYPAILFGGVFWPIEAIPPVLFYVSMSLPLTMATKAMRVLLTLGQGLMNRDVYSGFISTIVWIVIFQAISLFALRIKRS